MTKFKALTLLALIQVTALALGLEKPATPPLEFATEYVRELISIEQVRARGEADFKDTTHETAKLTSGIHFSTLIQIELRSQIRMLQPMRLTGKFKDVIPGLIVFDQQKIDLHERMINVTTEFLGAPKPGVDYGKLLAEIPKIRAELEEIDNTIFANVTPLACIVLIDMRPDSKNHVSHLVITKEEKSELVKKLVDGFGDAFHQETKNFMVSAGWIMKGFLEEHAASDDPWE